MPKVACLRSTVRRTCQSHAIVPQDNAEAGIEHDMTLSRAGDDDVVGIDLYQPDAHAAGHRHAHAGGHGK